MFDSITDNSHQYILDSHKYILDCIIILGAIVLNTGTDLRTRWQLFAAVNGIARRAQRAGTRGFPEGRVTCAEAPPRACRRRGTEAEIVNHGETIAVTKRQPSEGKPKQKLYPQGIQKLFYRIKWSDQGEFDDNPHRAPQPLPKERGTRRKTRDTTWSTSKRPFPREPKSVRYVEPRFSPTARQCQGKNMQRAQAERQPASDMCSTRTIAPFTKSWREDKAAVIGGSSGKKSAENMFMQCMQCMIVNDPDDLSDPCDLSDLYDLCMTCMT